MLQIHIVLKYVTIVPSLQFRVRMVQLLHFRLILKIIYVNNLLIGIGNHDQCCKHFV